MWYLTSDAGYQYPTLIDRHPGSFTCSRMILPIYMGPTALRGIRATGDTLSNVESQVFTPYKFSNPRPLDYPANVLPLGHGSLMTVIILEGNPYWISLLMSKFWLNPVVRLLKVDEHHKSVPFGHFSLVQHCAKDKEVVCDSGFFFKSNL